MYLRKTGFSLSFSIQASKSRPQYSSIDTSNSNIRPLVIISWQNIFKRQYVVLNSQLTTLPNENFYHEVHSGHILYCSRIRKIVKENRERRTEKEQRTENRQTENRETNYRGHYIAIPMESQVERANSNNKLNKSTNRFHAVSLRYKQACG